MDVLEVPEDDEGFVGFELVDDAVIEAEVFSEGFGNDVLGLRTLISWLELDLAYFFPLAVEVAETLNFLDDV